MSVSRVEYDAALKRVVKASLGCSMSSADSCPFRSFRCQCRTSTLAALGLDEPPTEATSDEARLRLGDRVCRHDDGPRRWTLPFCDGCGMLGRRTRESPVCDCGAVSYSEAQVVERAHLSRAEREHAEFVAQVTRRLNDLGVPACPSWPAAFDALDDIMNAARAVVPPTEPPKACPTSERDEYRRAIRSALDVMEGLTDEELGTGGGARRAYAALWHAYYAVPAGIPTGGSGIDGGTHD